MPHGRRITGLRIAGLRLRGPVAAVGTAGAMALSVAAIAASVAAAVGLHARRPAAASAARCSSQLLLGAGVPIETWRLGVVRFLSPEVGIALSAAYVPCYVPLRRAGNAVYWQRQPVRLAITHDGGKYWLTQGSTLPSGSLGQGESLAAISVNDIAAVTGAGLFTTTDGGVNWSAQTLPAPVEQVAVGGDTWWALSCRQAGQHTCRPLLEHRQASAGQWVAVSLPKVWARPEPAPLLKLPGNGELVIPASSGDGQRGTLLVSDDSGRRWTVRADPTWSDGPCTGASLLATAGPSDWWLLCPGGAAAGSSTKALVQSANGGASWKTVAAVRSLATPAVADQLPRADVAAFAAGSAARLWLAGYNELDESANAGVTWRSVREVNQEGLPSSFDVLSATTAWLLVSGQGMWRTTNGADWEALGPLHN